MAESIKKVDRHAEPTVLGTFYHFSRRNDKTMRVRVQRWNTPNNLLDIIAGPVRRTEQSWSIVASEVAG